MLQSPAEEHAMGLLADRRQRKSDESAYRAAQAAWARRDKDYDYRRRDLESISKYPDLANSPHRALSVVYRVRLIPRTQQDDVSPIVGNAMVQTHSVMLVTADTRMIVLMSWQFDECEELLVSKDNRTVAFATGRDDGSEHMKLVGSDDTLGWLTRVGWTCHSEGVEAAIKLIDTMQFEHRHNRPAR
jgi:hypothetical protein